MSTYVQADRPMTVNTPLGPDALLLTGFVGREAVSQLFGFQLDLVAENRTVIAFDKLLGQKVAIKVSLPEEKWRYFSGICNRISQGERDNTFTSYQMTVVPQFWLLTKRAQSRIFQRTSVPDILKKVLAGLDVAYEIQGTFHPRDYCVQYRETDFNFASRLMEEEGIYYFFRHTADGHKMVLANTPQSHPGISPEPGKSTVTFEKVSGGNREDLRVYSWEKVQELRSGKVTLWDHCFELPHKHLEAEKTIMESVQVGKVKHKLKVGGNDALEIYDFPGEYAQRFDGVNQGGGDRSADLQKIFEDNERTAGIRMQEEAVPGLVIRGAGNCRHFAAGHKFTVDRHFNAEGEYVLTGVQHAGRLSDNYRSGSAEFSYENSFTCIPLAVPFRPPRVTPKPFVQGTQTAVVVGPKGEEIFTDKYGRVKVQFHWDRQGKYDADSSCWIRASQPWAGKGWGSMSIPRIGQEVVVDFIEGDPDQPIITGRVYNADQMPPYALPGSKVVSGLKSNTHKGKGYNEMSMDDTAGKEKITVHAQYDMGTTVEHDMTTTVINDDTQTVHNNRTISVDGTHTETVKKATAITITEGTYSHDVAANTATYHVKAALKETYEDTQTTNVTNDILITSGTKITLTTGASKLEMFADGTVKLTARLIQVVGSEKIESSAPQVSTTGTQEVKMGVGNQSVTCNTAQVATSGAAIVSSAVGKHDITGALVKIN